MSRILLVGLLALPALAPDGAVILSMDELRHTVPKEKATAEVVAGKVGKAVKFAFEKDARSVFCTTNTRGTPDWDRAAGFSFWVRGYGTDGFGGLVFIHGGDFDLRYDYCFPIKGTEWTKVVVAWRDLVPVRPKGLPLDPAGAFKPSGLMGPWVGKWWYWRDYPALTFALDDFRLEPEIAAPPEQRPAGDPLARVRAKIAAGQAVTIVTLGDSLTDPQHNANRKVVWPDLLRERLKAEVKLINPAIGGTELRQGLALLPRSLAATPEPDLVTLCYGGNDWNSGMRGPQFAATCADAVERIRRATNGKADVLLMTTVPGVENWQTYAELSEAVRQTAKAKNAGLADVEAAFHAAKEDRARLFVADKVHLSPAGHALMAETVFRVLAGK